MTTRTVIGWGLAVLAAPVVLWLVLVVFSALYYLIAGGLPG